MCAYAVLKLKPKQLIHVNIWVYAMTAQKGQGCKILSLGTHIFTENLARGIGFTRELCWGYLSIFVNTSRKASFEIHLPSMEFITPWSYCNFTWWFKEGRSCSIVIPSLKSLSKLHTNTSSSDLYWRKRPNRWPIWNYATRTLTPWKGYLTRSSNPAQLRGSAHLWKL